jgi:hypothetical protein
MPETPVDKDDLIARSEDEVRLSGEARDMEAISVAQAMEHTTYRHFGSRIPTLYA